VVLLRNCEAVDTSRTKKLRTVNASYLTALLQFPFPFSSSDYANLIDSVKSAEESELLCDYVSCCSTLYFTS
jgi:hypothetical protein